MTPEWFCVAIFAVGSHVGLVTSDCSKERTVCENHAGLRSGNPEQSSAFTYRCEGLTYHPRDGASALKPTSPPQ
jgi:hypothetical protein